DLETSGEDDQERQVRGAARRPARRVVDTRGSNQYGARELPGGRLSAYAVRRMPIGRTRWRMYATNAAIANSTSVIAAELISARIRWKTVAETMTIMIPPAAQMTSPGRILVSPGRVSPTAASTSATPRKSWN